MPKGSICFFSHKHLKPSCNQTLLYTVQSFICFGLKMSWIFLLMENLNLGVTKVHANLD